MRLTSRVVRAGKQLAVLLPTHAVRAIGVQAGDAVEVTPYDGAIVIRRASRPLSLRDLVRRITPENRHDEIRWSPDGAGSHRTIFSSVTRRMCSACLYALPAKSWKAGSRSRTAIGSTSLRSNGCARR